MNMQYQDLEIAKNKIIKMYMRNQNRSISSTYRTLREKSYLSFFGDYPILSSIVTTIITIGIKPSRFQVTYALNQSDELRRLSKQEKNSLLNQLITPMSDQMKLTINPPATMKNKKMSNASS